MTLTEEENNHTDDAFNSALFEERVLDHCQTAIDEFKNITRSYATFHFIFAAAAFVEVLFFLLFFSLVAKSSFLALSLAVIFLTGFSYFVLLFYFQGKKPEQLLRLKTEYLEKCKKMLPFTLGMPDYHLSISHSLYRLIFALNHQEYTYYTIPPFLNSLKPLVEKFSVWIYWREVHNMKEMLFFDAIEEHLELVKSFPTDPETHASLAQGYLSLSRLYMDPRKDPAWQEGPWISSAYGSYEMQQKFKAALKRALEEFKILTYFSPQDPWVHSKLASIYHDLDMREQEIAEYETLLKLTVENKEVLLRLGCLYFKQGLCAQGLRIYEDLKKEDQEKAGELISYYDEFLRA